MARVALRVVDVVVEPAELGQAIQRHQEIAAPGEVDAHLGKLGKGLEHLGSDHRGDVCRILTAVVDPAAVEQAPVGGEAVVVEQIVAVFHRHVVGNQLAAQRLRQWLGGDDLSAAGHRLALQFRQHPLQVGITGHHHAPGAYAATRGGQRHRLAVTHPADRSPFVNDAAQRLEGGRLTQHQVERVQVAAGVVHQGTGVALAADLALVGLALQQLELVVAESLPQRLVLTQPLELLAVAGGEQIAVPEIAGDGVLADALADDAVALEGHVAQGAGGLGAVLGLDHVHVAAVAVDDLTAIAPRGAETDPGGFEHHHVMPLLGKMQRRRDPGEAGPHHAHLALDVAFEGGALGRRVGRGGIVGRHVLGVGTARHSYLTLNEKVIDLRSYPGAWPACAWPHCAASCTRQGRWPATPPG